MIITCCSLHEVLCDYVGGELCSESCEGIKAHLAACPPCATLVTDYKLTIQAGKCLPVRPVPDGLLERLRRAVGEVG
jgi:anti-sigma factor RsiW